MKNTKNTHVDFISLLFSVTYENVIGEITYILSQNTDGIQLEDYCDEYDEAWLQILDSELESELMKIKFWEEFEDAFRKQNPKPSKKGKPYALGC